MRAALALGIEVNYRTLLEQTFGAETGDQTADSGIEKLQ